MNWEAISAISAGIAAIAIVLTLIYLAIQIRQNTLSVRAEAYQAWVASNVELSAAVTNSDFSRALRVGIEDSTKLTEDSAAAFGMWNHSAFQMFQAIDTLYQMGVIQESLWKSEMSRAAGHLSNPGVRQWWDAGGKTQLTPEFVSRVETTVSDITVWAWDSERGYVSMKDAGAV